MIEKYGFTHLSAGDLIRAAVEDSSTEKGRYFNEVMSQGKLISTVMSKTRLTFLIKAARLFIFRKIFFVY